MTDLVERITRAIWEAVPSEGWHEGIRNDGGQNMYECQCMAEAAIAIVLEEAAKLAIDRPSLEPWELAAAIRNLATERD